MELHLKPVIASNSTTSRESPHSYSPQERGFSGLFLSAGD
jgi:hypothetical protein